MPAAQGRHHIAKQAGLEGPLGIALPPEAPLQILEGGEFAVLVDQPLQVSHQLLGGRAIAFANHGLPYLRQQGCQLGVLAVLGQIGG